jgi:hypothetical protein
MRRIVVGLVGVVFAIAGLAIAQDPPGTGDDPPVRLKKKHHPEANDKGPVAPPKPAEPPKDEPKPKAGPKDAPEPGAADEPEGDESEVLNRVGKNMRTSEDRLDRGELNDGTRQVQEDIVKDLDSLINQEKNGGGGEDQNQDQQQQDQQNQGQKPQSGQKQGQSGKQRVGMGKPKRGLRGGRQQQARAGQGKKSRQQGNQGQQQANAEQQGNQGQQQQAQRPNNQGGGGGQSKGEISRLDEMYKDVWGHLPETMRAQMNAYSREQFMAKYNDLIKQYYSTVAEKSRKKE